MEHEDQPGKRPMVFVVVCVRQPEAEEGRERGYIDQGQRIVDRLCRVEPAGWMATAAPEPRIASWANQ